MNPVYRTEDQDQWRFYYLPEHKDDPSHWMISVTKVLDTAQHQRLTDWQKKTSLGAQTKRVTEAGNAGSYLHDLVSKDLCGEQVKPDDRFLKTWDNWLTLKKEHHITADHSEISLYSTLFGVGGTADIIGTCDGKRVLMDLKTGRNYGIKTGWQMAMYSQMWKELMGEDLEIVGLQVPQSGDPASIFKYEHRDFCLHAFLSCLDTFKALYFGKLNKMGWAWLHHRATDEQRQVVKSPEVILSDLLPLSHLQVVKTFFAYRDARQNGYVL